MFRTTYLGHHSWLVSAGSTHLLVDPLLRDRFGVTDAVELRVYPPRVVDASAFPPIDAVLLTHEHEGHFDIPSLDLIDRRVPLYVSSRSSAAMHTLLQEMGFEVRPLFPGQEVTIGALELLPMTADQVHAVIEEWDMLAYLVRDTAGDGSFFTSVDMPPTDVMRDQIRARVDRPGLWAYTTNWHQDHFQTTWLPSDLGGLRRWVRRVAGHHEGLLEAWTAPEATLVIGGGWCFGGDLAWLNRNAFVFDNPEARDMLSPLFPDQRIVAPAAGETLVMKGGVLVDVLPPAPFAAGMPRAEWPARTFAGDVPWLDSYGPACGRTDLPAKDLPALREELRAFAGHLYGSAIFRQLHSLSTGQPGGRKPTFALALLADVAGGAYVYEYRPQACDFVPVASEDPVAEYLAVYECWATDLLATFRAEISQNALGFGRSRSWNHHPTEVDFELHHQIFQYVHPLRMPARFLDLYRRTLAGIGLRPTVIRAAARDDDAAAAILVGAPPCGRSVAVDWD